MVFRRVENAKPKVPGPPKPPKKAKTAKKEQGVASRRKSRVVDGEVVAEEVSEARIPVGPFDGEVARTRVSMGVTKSLGGFEFARLDISVELPCRPEDLDDTNLLAAQKADEFMQRELDSILPPDFSSPVEPVGPQQTNMSALTHGHHED